LAGFGNGGKSGHYVPSAPVPEQGDKPVLVYRGDFEAHYFSKTSGGNGYFELTNNQVVEAFEGDEITIDFSLPSGSATYLVNGETVIGQAS
jgi:hypothetical protein